MGAGLEMQWAIAGARGGTTDEYALVAPATVPALEVSDLTVRYLTAGGWTTVVHNVSYQLLPGETVGLIGESGSGKTTVARASVNLLPGNAEILSGSVRVDADGGPIDLLTSPMRTQRELRWRRLAYVSQAAASSFNPVLTIKSHFLDTAAAHGLAWAQAEGRARDLLAAVRLEADRVLDAYPHELSGGTCQRVMIALALLLGPSVVILDEPTTGLDLITQRGVLQIIRDLGERHRVAFLFVSHDLAAAAGIADRVMTMYSGRIVEDLHAPGVSEPLHPYTRALVAAAPRVDRALPVRSIPGSPPDPRSLPAGCPFHPRCEQAFNRCRQGAPPPLEPLGPGRVACHLFGRSSSR